MVWGYMGLSENVWYIPNEIAIFHRDNDQQNHRDNGVHYFKTNLYISILLEYFAWTYLDEFNEDFTSRRHWNDG